MWCVYKDQCSGRDYIFPVEFNMWPYVLVEVLDGLVLVHVLLLLIHRLLPVDETGHKFIPGTYGTAEIMLSKGR